ncbi:hypothetical protein [Clostridioides difficile]|uniref:hypothetical protein n=1 Tax=Clostridioides difficile TaxID=1496 RepID=UPI000940EF90|nr:hypothetical protein [Clostridioides difficile]
MAWVDIDKIINKDFGLSKEEIELKKEMEMIPGFNKSKEMEGRNVKGEKTRKANKKTTRCTRYPRLSKI